VAANNRHATRAQKPLRTVSLETFSPVTENNESNVESAAANNYFALREAARGSQLGLVSPKAFTELAGEHENIGSILVFARTHPQFVLRVKPCEALPEDSICLDEAQCRNFEVVVGQDRFPWSRFETEEVEALPALQQVLVEVRPYDVGEDKMDTNGDNDDDDDDDDDDDADGDADDKEMGNAGTNVGDKIGNNQPESQIRIERGELRSFLGKALFQQIITQHERIRLDFKGHDLLVTIRDVVAEEEAEEDEDKDLFLPDIVRGVVQTTTRWHIEGINVPGFMLDGEFRPFERIPPTNIVHVTCNDGEYFPVKKRLLQPCITLAHTVLSPNTESLDVDLDCCLFDKVLIYLEAEAKGLEYEIDLHEADELLEAAKSLRLIGLQRACEKVKNDFSNSLRLEGIPFEEIKQRNANGELLLIIDNQVCDVTDWLDLHPGGNTIIPAQALNVDATVLFEVYHATRESFLFLKQLYIGPLLEADHGKVPPPEHTEYTEPSESFLAQFREFMGQIKKFKSF